MIVIFLDTHNGLPCSRFQSYECDLLDRQVPQVRPDSLGIPDLDEFFKSLLSFMLPFFERVGESIVAMTNGEKRRLVYLRASGRGRKKSCGTVAAPASLFFLTPGSSYGVMRQLAFHSIAGSLPTATGRWTFHLAPASGVAPCSADLLESGRSHR